MEKHNVELAAPAERIYTSLCCLSAGETRSREEYRQLLRSINELIDEKISVDPFRSGRKLYGAIGDLSLEGLYWISQETLHVFYERSSKPRTIVVTFIWTAGPNTEANIQCADVLFAQMLLSGQFAVPGIRLSAAN
jgi:hypothetical protein